MLLTFVVTSYDYLNDTIIHIIKSLQKSGKISGQGYELRKSKNKVGINPADS